MGPEVHFKIGLSFKFFFANLTLMHSSFVPANKSLVELKLPNFEGTN